MLFLFLVHMRKMQTYARLDYGLFIIVYIIITCIYVSIGVQIIMFSGENL